MSQQSTPARADTPQQVGRLSRRGTLLGWTAMVLLLAFAVRRAMVDPLAAPLPTRVNTALDSGQDFRDAAYYPVKELLSGGDPYDPAAMFKHWPVRQEFDLYAPLHLVLHLPYAALPYRPALIIYSLVGIGYLLAIGLICARVMRLRVGRLSPWLVAWFVGVAVVLAQFGKSAVYFGQINTLVGLGAVLAITQTGRTTTRSVWLTAIGLALAWIKPQFGIPLTVLLLARGTWRQALLGTGLAGLVSLPVVGVLVVRAGGIPGFVEVIRRNLEYATGTAYGAVDSMTGARVDIAAVVYRVTGWIAPGAELVVLGSVLGLSGWLVSRRRGRPFDVPELLLVSVACLVCIVHQQSESLITVPAIVGIAALLLGGRRPPVALLVATAFVWVPVVHVHAVELLLISHVSARFDSLIEGLSLLAAFVLTSTWMIASRACAAGTLGAPEPAQSL